MMLDMIERQARDYLWMCNVVVSYTPRHTYPGSTFCLQIGYNSHHCTQYLNDHELAEHFYSYMKEICMNMAAALGQQVFFRG